MKALLLGLSAGTSMILTGLGGMLVGAGVLRIVQLREAVEDLRYEINQTSSGPARLFLAEQRVHTLRRLVQRFADQGQRLETMLDEVEEQIRIERQNLIQEGKQDADKT